MREPLRVGVVGAGYFAQFHHQAWQRMHDVTVVAIAERDPKRRAEAATNFGIPASYGDLAELLASEDCDIIDIATPPDTHLEAIRLTTANAITTICQKPFCGGLAGAREAVALADASGSILIVHENFRFQPWYRAIKDVLDGKTLGTVFQVQFRLRPGDGQGADAYLSRQPYFQEMPRFLVHETAIHLIDVFRFLLGEPNSVYADLQRLNPAIRGEDAGVIVLGYDDGVRAIFDGNRLADHPASNPRLTMGELVVECEKGTLRLNGDGQVLMRGFGERTETPVAFSWVNTGFGGDCVYLFQRAVVDALRSGAPLETRASDYLKNLQIVEAVYQSNAAGQRVAV